MPEPALKVIETLVASVRKAIRQDYNTNAALSTAAGQAQDIAKNAATMIKGQEQDTETCSRLKKDLGAAQTFQRSMQVKEKSGAGASGAGKKDKKYRAINKLLRRRCSRRSRRQSQ